MSGLDFMQALARGELPEAPIATLIDTQLRSASDGEVVFTLTPNESHFSGLGVVHGAGGRPLHVTGLRGRVRGVHQLGARIWLHLHRLDGAA